MGIERKGMVDIRNNSGDTTVDIKDLIINQIRKKNLSAEKTNKKP